MPDKTFDTNLMIVEKHDAANYATGVYRYPGSKQIASNTIVPTKTKQQSAGTQTSNFGHAQNPSCQNNQKR
jgi:hypothetical protein